MKRLFVMRWRTLVIVVISLVLIGGLVFSVVFFILGNQDKATPPMATNRSDLCNTDSIGEELKTKYAYFGPDKIPEMVEIIDKILQTPEYENGENCLYVLGKFHAYIGDSGRVKQNYEKLIELSTNNEVWIDDSIGLDSKESIEAHLQALKEQSKEPNNASMKGRIPDVRKLNEDE